jgi:hypothetical protein
MLHPAPDGHGANAKDKTNRRKVMTILRDSPVEIRRKEMPRGDGDWPGFDRYYERLQDAAKHLSRNGYTRLHAPAPRSGVW